MTDIDERKSARDAYLKALEAQKMTHMSNNNNNSSNSTSNNNNNNTFNNNSSKGQQPLSSAAEKREKLIEERRKKFFESTSKVSQSDPSNNAAAVRMDDSKALLESNQSLNGIDRNKSIMSGSSGGTEMIRPSDWESRGYPSEYAYMKAQGGLEIPSIMTTKVTEDKFNSQNTETFTREVGRKHSSSHDHRPTNDDNNAADSYSSSSMAGNGRQQQQQQQQQQEISNAIPHIAGNNVGLSSFGAVDDKEAKRQKQLEYARSLDQQKQYQQPPAASHHASVSSNNNHYASNDNNHGGGGGGGGLSSFGAVDDKEAKRQKQLEYARSLDQQKQYQQPPASSHHASVSSSNNHYASNDNNHGGGGGGGLSSFGAVDDKEAKRQKQLEYARSLDQQKQYQQPPASSHHSSSQASRKDNNSYHHLNALSSDGVGSFGAVNEKDIKKQKQLDYARQLNEQNENRSNAVRLNKFGDYDYKQINNNNDNNTSMPHNNSSVMNIGYDNNPDDRARLRSKQTEYAQSLLQQQMIQKYTPNSKENPSKSSSSSSSNPSGIARDGSLEAGWVLGPLGLPVRKTLDVGNRGQQRAYLDQVIQNLSPNKMNDAKFGNNFHDDANPTTEAYLFGLANANARSAQSNSTYGIMAHSGIGDTDDRELKAKMLKVEQAKVLEMQILSNKERKDQEKRKAEHESMVEEMRLEQQRVDLQKKFQKEEQEKKLKIEDDNRRGR
jgi:hypothetical protein